MLSLLFVICIVVFIICARKKFEVLPVLFAIVAIVLFIAICFSAATLGTASRIDQKIEMYEKENSVIESRIDSAVENYIKYEASTYTEIKDKDAITLVSLFPELKADELVQQQLYVYVANNQKIKELRETKIDLSMDKFLLYFGH